MFNLTEISLKNDRTTWVIYAVFMLIGFSTYFSIGRLEYPEFTIRNAQVITQYPGRSSVEVELEVTHALEQSIRRIPEVDTIKSTSKPGVSIISVELKEEYFDLEPIWQDMRNIITETQLPSGAQTPSVNDSFGDVFPYVFALQSDGFSLAEMKDYADDIRDALLTVEGVSKVEFHGTQAERIYLEFSSSELVAYGTSPEQIAQQLSGQNAVASSGSVRAGIQRMNLVTLGEFDSIEELANYRIAVAGQSTTIRVSDLVEIKREYIDPPSSIAHFNGEQIVCIAASMSEGYAVTEVGKRIQQKLAEVQTHLPWGIEIETMFYQPVYVDQSIRSFVVNLGQAFFFSFSHVPLCRDSPGPDRGYFGALGHTCRFRPDACCRCPVGNDVHRCAHHCAWAVGRQCRSGLRADTGPAQPGATAQASCY